jgi:hypothetical protein
MITNGRWPAVELRGLEPLAFWMQNIGTAQDRRCLPRLPRLFTVARGRGCALGLLYFAAVQRSSHVGGDHLIRRNLHATPGPAQIPFDLRRLSHYLASFVTVERPCKAKIRPTRQSAALSAWELDCHAFADQRVARQALCPVAPEYPLSTGRTPYSQARSRLARLEDQAHGFG